MATEFSRETVKRIAELGRLYLSEEEITTYQAELAKILEAFNTLANLPLPEDFAGDARSALVMAKAIAKGETDSISRLRPDEVNNSISTQVFLSQAPEREGVFVRVPAILAPST
jgi:aspartyl-tRNA(Asn)/glutamyl-tRNA(Gln) amidotransferase subunit C